MKSKLTLRLDEDLKEEAKRLASERGLSVSRLVEEYFRLLLSGSEGSELETSSEGDTSDVQGNAPFTDRIETLKRELGRPAPSVVVDEDTRDWIEAAARKHE